MKEMDTLILRINNFKLKNNIYKGRLKDKNVYVEVDVPNLDKDTK